MAWMKGGDFRRTEKRRFSFLMPQFKKGFIPENKSEARCHYKQACSAQAIFAEAFPESQTKEK